LDEYVPTPHAVHSTPSDEAVNPTLQVQLDSDGLASPELVPLGHVMQLPTPVTALYKFIPHALHAVPSEPVYPARHVQSVAWLLPTTENVLAGQGVLTALVHHVSAGHASQDPVPVACLYIPTAHTVHSVPSVAPLYPVKHMQFDLVPLPDTELVPRGHTVQLPAPVNSLYDPSRHGLHVVDPVANVYVPTRHALHAVPADEAEYPARHVQFTSEELANSEKVLAGQYRHVLEPES
jgi:hypothetical protein